MGYTFVMKNKHMTYPCLAGLAILALTFTGCELVEYDEQGPGPVVRPQHHHDHSLHAWTTHESERNQVIFTLEGRGERIQRAWLFCRYPGSGGQFRIPMHRLSAEEFQAVIPHRRAHHGQWHYHIEAVAGGKTYRIPHNGQRSFHVPER